MYRKSITLVLLFFTWSVFGQDVNIPDANFLSALIDEGVDTNNDGIIQVSEAEAVSILDVEDQQVSNLDGIEAFVNLEYLNCSDNSLDSLGLFANVRLTYLMCSFNELSYINVSNCSGLQVMDCRSNNLISLDLSNNLILELLACGDNLLEDLELTQCAELYDLHCSSNKLLNLDVTQNAKLESINCDMNLLTTLDVSQNTELKDLECRGNMLTVLDVSKNPFLFYLACDSNALTTLDLSNNAGVYELNCENNFLKTLDLSGNPELHYLNCINNQLENINVSQNIFLGQIACGLNSLTTLDLSQNQRLHAIDLDSSDLIRFICAHPDNITIVYDEVENEELGQVVVSLYCNYDDNNYVEYKPVIGFALDQNCDPFYFLNEIQLQTVIDGDTTSLIYTGNGSVYLPLISDIITIIVDPQYFSILTVLDSFYQLDSMSLIREQDSFGVYNDTLCAFSEIASFDLMPMLIPEEIARPGFDVSYKLVYQNRGTLPASGTIGMKYDSSITEFVGADLSPISQLGDSLVWEFSDLLPFERREIMVSFRLNSPMDNPPLNGGDLIEYHVCMLPSIDDYQPDDNCFTLSQVVVNSFDPNDKTCLQGSEITPDMVGDWLTYKIRFENEGTAEAVNIRIEDNIDQSVFDISTLTPIDASHPYHIELFEDNKVHFVFPNIFLPFDDDNNDGYVVFRIRTLENLVLGDTIANEASIFFDFNFPIETNEYITEVKEEKVSILNIQQLALDLKFSPNPARTYVVVESPEPMNELTLINSSGRMVHRVVFSSPTFNTAIALKELSSGMYIVEARTTNDIVTGTLIVK